MKVTHSNIFFSSVLAASLLLAPSSLGAEVFGYAGIKAGYLHQSASRLDLVSQSSNLADNGIFFDAFSSSSLPLGANVGLGYYFTSNFGFRVEAEYLYRIGLSKTLSAMELKDVTSGVHRPVDSNAKASISAQTFLGNFYLDYYVTPSVNLYLSAGLGMGILNTELNVTEKPGEGNTTKASKNSLAWQIGLGTGYALTQNLGLDFNVRYIGLGKLRAGTNLVPTAQNAKGEASISAVEALIGLNFRF